MHIPKTCNIACSEVMMLNTQSTTFVKRRENVDDAIHNIRSIVSVVLRNYVSVVCTDVVVVSYLDHRDVGMFHTDGLLIVISAWCESTMLENNPLKL